MDFIPDQLNTEVEVPFFEDATGEIGIKGHTTQKSMDELKAKIATSLGRLDAQVVSIRRGQFPTSPKRDGFRVNFIYMGNPSRLDVAALPIKGRSEKKRKQALKQALFSINYALEAQYLLTVLSPGSAPLVPYMLVADTGKTIVEIMRERGDLPSLSSGEDSIVEGIIVDEE